MILALQKIMSKIQFIENVEKLFINKYTVSVSGHLMIFIKLAYNTYKRY